MSLYHEAASILTKSKAEGASIRTVVFAKKDWKSPPKVLLALASEAAKWSSILSEVVEHSGILRSEKQLTPVLGLVLAHDLLLARRGVALPATHGLNACVQRNKARLSAELSKTRIRRGCSTLDQLRSKVEQEATDDAEDGTTITAKHPRWIRINTIRSTKDEQFATTFAEFAQVDTIQEILRAGSGQMLAFVDSHIPNLIAIPSTVDMSNSKAYKDGKIIFQDKASCFPAYLTDPKAHEGDVIDACAAPGNKTTHLAAILDANIRMSNRESAQTIFACEKDTARSQTLTKMTALAGGSKLIEVRRHQNFLKLDPNEDRFANVTKLLLDPSCSGSGIVSRDQGAVTVHLPEVTETIPSKNKKRKRTHEVVSQLVEEETSAKTVDDNTHAERLQNLADFQLRLLLHAMKFPAAVQISYSTCSIHAQENEEVVIRALQSQVALDRGWTVQRRSEQAEGIRNWHIRGDLEAVNAALKDTDISINISEHDLADACVRCNKHGTDGTMGFFVAGFVRRVSIAQPPTHGQHDTAPDEWSGFDDT